MSAVQTAFQIGTGFNNTHRDIKNKNSNEKSKISSPSNVFLTLGSVLNLPENQQLVLNFRMQQIYYKDSAFYEIVEDKNFLFDLEVGLKTKLTPKTFLATSLTYSEHHFFTQQITTVTSSSIGSLGLKANISYNFYSLNGVNYISYIHLTFLSPNKKDTIETENGNIYGVTLLIDKKSWPREIFKSCGLLKSLA